MRTIFPNSRALCGLALIVFTFFFLIVSLSHVNNTYNNGNELLPSSQIIRAFRNSSQRHGLNLTSKGEEERENKPQIVHPVLVSEKRNQSAEQSIDQNDKAVLAKPNKPSPEYLENKNRSEKVREMMRHAWNSYHKFAWGANELKPIAKRPNNQLIFGGKGMMATIVDAADTLWMMGLTDEFQQAHDRIRDYFNVSEVANAPLSVFEVTIRHIGGFLSLYALTKENIFMEKARDLATLMLPAFETPTGIAKSFIDPRNNASSNYMWAGGGSSVLSEFGSLHMEFDYLSNITGNPIFAQKVQKIRDVLDRAVKKDGLYSTYMAPETGVFVGGHVSIGALGDSFFELLLKSWLMSGKTDNQAYRMYKDASKAIQNKMIFTSKGNLTYVAELRSGIPDHKMSHLACFVPGMFALESMVEMNPRKKAELIRLAEAVGHTCHESYRRSATGIGPEVFFFIEGSEATSTGPDSGYILRPEAIEGWFYLWRLTRNKKYKEWVFDAITAIDKYCRVENGFVGLRNVYKPEEGYDDVQQSFFLAETLKYAYLTFNDNEFPLDKWVFNTEAHPFPIMEHNKKI